MLIAGYIAYAIFYVAMGSLTEHGIALYRGSSTGPLKRELAIPTIMVTHDLNEALLLSNQMVLLNQGQALQSGVPKDVLARPVSEVATRLIGIQNIFSGEIVENDHNEGISWLRTGDMLIAIAIHTERHVAKVESRIRWMIPNNAVRLPSLTDGEIRSTHNRVQVQITNMLILGDEVRISATMQNMAEPIYFEAPLQLVQKLDMQIGRATDVNLRKDRIHYFAN